MRFVRSSHHEPALPRMNTGPDAQEMIVCTSAATTCRITVQTKGNELIEVNSSHGAGRNNGDLFMPAGSSVHASTTPPG